MPVDASRIEGDDPSGLPRDFTDAIARRYVLEREIGRGGMAIVWSARRVDGGERVALKVLRPALAEALGEQRFVQEIRIASSLSSDALMPLFDSGEIAGLPYYAMPFAEGGSLRDRLRDGQQLGFADAVAIARRIAVGLVALHAGGFIHRDIKPENVLLSAAGDAFLADYGIAHALIKSTRESFSTTGIIVGTPSYMSPEHGAGGVVDQRSDLYSLGCVLYEMLAGSPPFPGGNSQSIIARHMSDVPPSLGIVRATIPEALEAIVMRLLAKVPADRFADAQGVVDALDALGQVGESIVRRTHRPTERRRRRSFLRRAASLGAILAIPAAALLASTFWPVALDPDRVIVFPLTAAGGGMDPAIDQMPMLVGSALDRAAVSNWVDGSALLTETERARREPLGRRRARSLARRERARYYVDGAVASVGDSTTVQLRVHDVSSGQLLDTKSESGPRGTAVGDLVLRTVVRVLPALTGLETVVDVSAMVGRDPAAIDNWLRGERAYRQSRMHDALKFLELAVAADSTLTPAAFRAAAAAGWIGRPERALQLVGLALGAASALPERDRQFATALDRFLSGRADDAIIALRPLLTREMESADAWMLAGEVYLHLQPRVAVDERWIESVPAPTEWPFEAFARDAFETARRLDPGYSPPLAHLADMAARRGDLDQLTDFTAQLARTRPDSVLERRLTTAARCLRLGPDATDWDAIGRRSESTLWHVGFMLRAAQSARGRACASSAFAAALRVDVSPDPEDWGSLVSLHGMTASAGRSDAALALVDSAMRSGMPEAIGLFVLDREAGLEVGSRADAFLAELRSRLESRQAPSLWLLTLDAARAHDPRTLERVHATLRARRRESGERLDSLIFDVSAAFLARERRDTLEALRRFDALGSTAGSTDLLGSLWEALAPERMAYAELLLASGDAVRAHRVASSFDQPEIIVNELFLRASLALRIRAATALQDTVLAARSRRRLAMIEAGMP